MEQTKNSEKNFDEFSGASARQAENRHLQTLRKAHGYKSANAFADDLDMPRSTYTHYEQNELVVPLGTAANIADAFGCSIDALIGRNIEYGPQKESPVQDEYDLLDEEDKRFIQDMFEFVRLRRAKRDSEEARILREQFRSALYDELSDFVHDTGYDVETATGSLATEMKREFEAAVTRKRAAARAAKVKELGDAFAAAHKRNPSQTDEQLKLLRRHSMFTGGTKKEFETGLKRYEAKLATEDEQFVKGLMKAYEEERGRLKEKGQTVYSAVTLERPEEG